MKKRMRIPGLAAPMLALGMLAGLIGLTAFLQPDTASADQAKFYLDCPTSEVREGGDVDVFLVRVTNHQHGVTFGAYWHTDAGTAGTDDYVHQDTGAIWSNESERLANRAKRTFRTREDALVEGNETFTARFSPVDNVVDRDDPTRDEKCEITIVDDDPNITGIEVISDPARDNNTYGVGETIEIEATFSTSVDVDGNPGLGLSVGSNWRSASYLRGSGSDTLVFGYTVKADDRDSDGIKMDGGYQDSSGTWHNLLNHTAITATGTGTVAYRVYAGIGDQSDHKVDGSLTPVGIRTEITSSPESGDTYRYGETIDFSITFSGLLEVDGSRHLSLRVGSDDAGGWRGATYQSGSGTNTLVFGYTVQTGDLDDDGVTMLGTWVEGGAVHGLGGSGTVTVEGTDIAVTPTFTGLSNQSGHQLDGRPYPRSISITSSPMSKSDTYGRDEVIQVSVNFDQNVTARGGAVAILRMGYGWRQRIAPYVSGNGTDTLAFEYKVVEEDIDENGVDAFLLHGRDIRATGTDIAYQPNPGGVTPQTGDDSDHKVDGSLVTLDTTSPTVSSVEITSDPGDDDTYGRGDWVAVLVTFSESVLVTGEPLLELNIGGVARTAEYGLLPDGTIIDENSKRTPHSKVSFGYTVREGDVDTDGISIGADRLTLNGGAIRDEANNDAVLTHDAVDAYYGHRVNAPDVTAPTVSSVEITSDPGDDDTYGTGDSIEVTVTFSEDVTVDGLIELELDIGGAARTAENSGGEGAEAVFSYAIASGDNDSDGIAIGANKLSINDGTIRDGSDNDATLTHGAVDADSGHRVDTIAPTISTIAITSDSGSDYTYRTGDTIQVTVTFSEDVTVTGTPQLELFFNQSGAVQASYVNVTGAAVVFEYTVTAEDESDLGIAIRSNKLDLNGGSIGDAAGNDAVLDNSTVDADPGHLVNRAGGL